jgi:hypothetical protein
MNQLTDAYVAGLVDGEGCIGVQHNNDVYAIRVDVGMTTKAAALLWLLRSEYGGRIRIHRRQTERWDAAEGWSVHGVEAAAFIRRIQPYLRLKSEQAQIALKLESIRLELPLTPTGRARWTGDARARCATLKRRMHELNQKGPVSTPEPGEKLIARLVAGEWVTDQADLFSDLGWESYSGRWPRSGSMRNGFAYEHPIPVRHTVVSGSSSPPTLPGTTTHGLGIPASQHAPRSAQESNALAS